MAREQVYVNIPPEWDERRKAGLCPICGKTRDEFDKDRKVYCSEPCAKKIEEHIIYWNSLRIEVIKRDGKCLKCGDRAEPHEVYERRLEKWRREIAARFKDQLKAWQYETMARLEKHYMDEIKQLENLDNFESYQILHALDRIADNNGIEIPKQIREPNFEVDHITPICKGGAMWDKKNLQTLCKDCHLEKTKKDLSNPKEIKQ